MPRFGKQFKVYDRILPSQLLDVTDVIENSPRQCIICGKLATLECLECNGEHGGGGLLDRENVFISPILRICCLVFLVIGVTDKIGVKLTPVQDLKC